MQTMNICALNWLYGVLGARADRHIMPVPLALEHQGPSLDELHTVEKRFRLLTGFRLRQELPDFW